MKNSEGLFYFTPSLSDSHAFTSTEMGANFQSNLKREDNPFMDSGDTEVVVFLDSNYPDVDNADHTSITRLSDGSYVIVFAAQGDNPMVNRANQGIFAQRVSSDGQLVGNLITINAVLLNQQTHPEVTATANGFAVAWQDASVDRDFDITMRYFSNDGVPVSNDIIVNTNTDQVQSLPDLTTLSNGNVVVVWEDRNPTGAAVEPGAVKARIFDSTGNPVSTEIQIDSILNNGQVIPKADALSDGRFVVSWSEINSSGSWDIEAAIFNADGTSARSVIDVATSPVALAVLSDIAALQNGSFVVTYLERSTSNPFGPPTIKAQIYDSAGNTAGLEITVGTATSPLDLRVVSLTDGGFVIGWDDQGADGSGFTILGRAYTASGVPQGEAFIANTHTSGNQLRPALATGPDGSYVFAWSGFVDVNAAGVAAQLFQTDDGGNSTTPTEGDDVLDGTNGDDVIDGLGGNDMISGGDGNDILDGGTGIDTLTGGNGDDTYIVDSFADIIIENAMGGNDVVFANSSYILSDHIETGVSLVTGAAAFLNGNAQDNLLIMSTTFAGSAVDAGAGADVVYVQSGTTILGGAGADTLVLQGSGNTAYGGADDDVYIVSAAGNIVGELAGEGTDTVYAIGIDFTLGANIETLALISANIAAFQSGTGNDSNNTLIGNGANNALSGQGGADFIVAGAGDDFIAGGEGLDTLQGNSGNDIFVYNTAAEAGDIIQDWIAADDGFLFSAFAFGFTAGETLVDGVNFISGTDPLAALAQATFLWDSDDTNLFYDADGSGAGAAILVADLQAFTDVTVADFGFV